MSAWSNPVATAFLGFTLAIAADPLKQAIRARLDRREALRRLYDDLGRYLGRVEATSLLDRLDLLLWREVTNPQAPNFDYYLAHEPGVLLRADTKRGVYLLVERLRGLAEAYRQMDPVLPDGKTNDHLPESFFGDVVYRYQELLGDKCLDRRRLLRACAARRQPIAGNRPPVLGNKQKDSIES
jgi:hypothetical protein